MAITGGPQQREVLQNQTIRIEKRVRPPSHDLPRVHRSDRRVVDVAHDPVDVAGDEGADELDLLPSQDVRRKVMLFAFPVSCRISSQCPAAG
jgi:hypothetical protein